MNGALLSGLVGLWVLAQVFKGQALQRLGIIGSGVTSDSSSAAPGAGGSGGGFSQGTQTKIPGSA